MNSWWGNSRVASGVLTQWQLNKAISQMLAYGVVSPRHAQRMLGFKDIEWIVAIEDALLAVLYA